MPVVPVDTSASVSPLIAAVSGSKIIITSYNLQAAGDVVVKLQNNSDNSDIDTVIGTSGGGGLVWEGAESTKEAKMSSAVNLILSAAVRVVGSVSYTRIP